MSTFGEIARHSAAAFLLIAPVAPQSLLPARAPGSPIESNANLSLGDPEEIIVTGRHVDDESLRSAAKLFGRKIEATPVDGQIARWNDPICPKVHGIDQRLQEFVTSRIKQIAREVGAPLAGEQCRANMLITFTTDAKGLVAAIERRSSQTFSAATFEERAILRNSSAPVRWWYTALTEGSDGASLLGESPALISESAVLPRNGKERYLSSVQSSLIDSKFRATIARAAVLIDVNQADGHSLHSVADYAAFVALARVRSDIIEVPDTPSIVALFTPRGSKTEALTEWDMAYLQALYKAPANRAASVQRKRIVNEMVEALNTRKSK